MKIGLVTEREADQEIAYAMFSGKLPDRVAIYPWNRGFPKIGTRKEHRGRHLGVRIASSDRVYLSSRTGFEVTPALGKEVLCRITHTDSGFIAAPWVLLNDVHSALEDIIDIKRLETILRTLYPLDRK